MTTHGTFGAPDQHMLEFRSAPHTASYCSRCVRWLTVALLLPSALMAQRTNFDVYKGDVVIGRVVAMRSTYAERTIYVMTSHSEFNILWKHVVRSSAQSDYENGVLVSCHTSVRVNNAVRDSSSMKRSSGQCYVHPGVPTDCDQVNPWTTARMYYEEPVGLTSIFVESLLSDRPLKKTGPETYSLELGKNHTNHYRYVGGILQEVRVNRAYVDLIFKRT